MPPARPLYFPVLAEPLRMQAGLHRFGTDFGNPVADRLFFPRDADTADWLAAKAQVLAAHPERNIGSVQNDDEARAVEAARAFIVDTLAREGVHLPPARRAIADLGQELAEDFVVVHRPSAGRDRAVWVHACFPSGWRPERVLGRSFLEIHAAVPAFDSVKRSATALSAAITERGPYVRFVWTVSADRELDHHPEQGRRAAWSAATAQGFLRVERQTTVPLPAAQAMLFLIRTYLHAFAELSPEQRATLSSALAQMPPDVVHYKRLEAALPHAIALLAPSAP